MRPMLSIAALLMMATTTFANGYGVVRARFFTPTYGSALLFNYNRSYAPYAAPASYYTPAPTYALAGPSHCEQVLATLSARYAAPPPRAYDTGPAPVPCPCEQSFAPQPQTYAPQYVPYAPSYNYQSFGYDVRRSLSFTPGYGYSSGFGFNVGRNIGYGVGIGVQRGVNRSFFRARALRAPAPVLVAPAPARVRVRVNIR